MDLHEVHMKINKPLINRILAVSSTVMFSVILIFVTVLLIMGFTGKLARNDNQKNNGGTATIGSVILTTSAAADSSETPVPQAAVSTPTPSPQPVTYKEITLLSAGDMMLYASMSDSAKKYGGDTHDFSELTRYVKEIISSHSYSVVNFEATLAGGEKGYSYYPAFNVPDGILKTAKEAGFDMMLFANNHTYDSGHAGLIRTQEKFAENSFDCLGTRLSEENKSYTVKDVSGVKLGMLNYTYEAPPESEKNDKTQKFLNGIRLDSRDINLVDSFNENRLEDFYGEVKERISEMKLGGASFIVMFIHWGNEYEHSASTLQKEIAQRLCELGVDLLIGSHPHVVQPVATYTAADNTRTMLCYYSLGNFTSAQNRLTFSEENYERGIYTENGLMASVTIRKYSTGETVISRAGYYATWMHRHSVNGRLVFNVVPLEKALASDETKAAYGLTESSFGVEHAAEAYRYITELVQPGINAFNSGIKFPYPENTVEQE